MDQLRDWLAEARIGSEIYYPLGLDQQECFRSLGYAAGDLPETERAAREVLALTIFPELTDREQRAVVARSGALFAARSRAVPAPKFLTQPARSRPCSSRSA